MFSQNLGRCMFLLYMIATVLLPVEYKFMVFNLFLAFIPYELSHLFLLFKPYKKRDWPIFIGLIFIFTLMLPNIFYTITDLIHLNIYAFDFLSGLSLNEWLNFTYLVIGVMIGLYFYISVLFQLEHLTSRLYLKMLTITSAMLISSFGIFIGRFLRFHSVHLFSRPLDVAVQTFQSLNMTAIVWMLLLTILQFVLWLLVKGVRRL